MKKCICLLLIAVLLCACGCDKQETKQTDPNDIYEEELFENQPAPIGTWTAQINLTDPINDHLSGITEVDLYFMMDEFLVDVEMTFRKDGTFRTSIDKKAVNEGIDTLIAAAEDALMMQLEEQLMMYQMDRLSEDPEDTMTDITLEEMLIAEGTTLEKTREDFMATVGGEALRQQILTLANREGIYVAEGGCLYLSDDTNTIDRNVFDVYTLEGDVLTLHEQYGSEDETAAIYLYPLEFAKTK